MPDAEPGAVPGSHASARRPSGELEASVLAALWAAAGRPLTPADVQRELGADLARTTVTTILARLHDKGAVSRTRAGRGYAYLPAQDPPGLAARRMRSELDKSAEGQRGTVLARFVSELEPADEELLRSLLGQVVAQPGTEGAGPAGSAGAPGRRAAVEGEAGSGSGLGQGVGHGVGHGLGRGLGRGEGVVGSREGGDGA